MSNKIRYCLLCQRYDGRTKRSGYTRISTIEREEKLREGYRYRYNGQKLDQPILNQLVHQKCYNKTIQYIPPVDSTNNISISMEQNHDDEQDQELIVQSRSRAILPKNVKSLLERSQRVCIVCHSYKYSYTNRLKQIVSNFMANKLAQGYLHRYKRPYGKSLLDAYIHDICYRKLYASSRCRTSKRNHLQYQQTIISQQHETRSRSNLNKTETVKDESTDLSIEDLLSRPLSLSVATTNPHIELSARSCLFRPCIQRLSSEEIKFYTKRNTIDENNTDQLPIIDSSFTIDNDDNINEEILPTYNNKQSTINNTAKISYRSIDSHKIDHNYTPYISTRKFKHLNELDKLYDWLIEQLNSSEYPISMGDVLTKYNEFIDENKDDDDDNNTKIKRESSCRIQLRNNLEKHYPNEFKFIIPNRRDGTFIGLNNIDHYIRSAIKKSQEAKEKATETSIISSIVIPRTEDDYKRETCELIMNSIRKIRLYIRDSKQINSTPSLFMQNLVGLITSSERQFDKISHNYDFYRMIDENLFEEQHNKISNKPNKTIRNISLASDLISARHDHHISQKHYLLADEIANENFHCTPRKIITLLNRYGHTCSYKSYQRMKTLVQRTTNQLGEKLLVNDEQSSSSSSPSSDLELDLMEL